MPSAKQIPENKRRSRKGCITCRKRRRKCDEQKPRCRNCCARNVTCTYGDWTFVSQGPHSFVSDEPSQEDHTIDDVQDFTAVNSPPPIALRVPNGTPSPQLPFRESVHSQILSPLIDRSARSSSAHVAVQGQGSSNDEALASWPLTYTGTEPIYEATTPSRWIDSSLSQRGSLSPHSALLRFRYQVVPWIDAGNCKSTFGPTIMTLARSSRVVLECILYCMRLRDKAVGTPGSVPDDLGAHQRLLDDLAREDALTADVGRALLNMSDVLGTPPSEWSTIPAPRVQCFGERPQNQHFASMPEPLKTLLRLRMKIDIAACIATNKPPAEQLAYPWDVAGFGNTDSAVQSYDECLYCLTESLQLVHHQLIPLLSGFHESHRRSSDAHVLGWDRWSDLWRSCTEWFQTRPRSMQPVLETSPGSEHHAQPFGTDVFTSATALQANLVMHMSAIVLLTHRPRLVNFAGLSPRVRSRSWHIQKIARMLVGNRFYEQWDPIVIAALLFVAKEMSHVSQQKVLSLCFQEITRTTQIPIEKDVSILRASWQLILQ